MKKFPLVLCLILALSPVARAANVSDWARESVTAAEIMGIIHSGEDKDLTIGISRRELCSIAVNVYEAATGDGTVYESPFADAPFNEVGKAVALGLMSVKASGFFDPQGIVTRQEGAKVFSVLAEKLGITAQNEEASFADEENIASWAKEYVSKISRYGYLTGDYKGEFLPESLLTTEQAVTVAVRILDDAVPNAWSTSLWIEDTETPQTKSSDGYVYNGKYKRNNPAEVFTEGEITTKEEADRQMVTVTVDIWELKNGEKVQGKMNLTVHKNIKEAVEAVFAEIFAGDEKFPINKYSTYCYSFRNTAGGRLSEHATGTAIDINPDENQCIYSNGSVVGSLYAPGENPYSIEKYGDCWNAFVRHGFTWGGDAWDSPQDYMHFSYLGK